MQEVKVDIIGDLYESNGYGSQAGRVYGTEGCSLAMGAAHFNNTKYITEVKKCLTGKENKGCLSRAEQSRAEQSRAEQLNYSNSPSNEEWIHRSRHSFGSGLGLSDKSNEKGESDRERTGESDTDYGEYP